MSNNPTASVIYLKILYRILDSYGVNTKRFLDSLKLTNKLSGHSARQDSGTIAGTWKEAANVTGIDNLALKAGMHAHPSDYGVMSYVWMNCSNFFEIMEFVCKYKKLLNQAFSAELRSTDSGYEYVLESTLTDDSYLIEYDFASILYMGYFAAGKSNESQVSIKSIEFKHSANSSYEDYQRCFKCDVKFSQKKNRMLLSKQVLDTVVVSPNSTVRSAMLNIIEKIKYDELGAHSFSEKVSNYLEEKISRGQRPSQDETAIYFNCSPSTFKRRLNLEEISFSRILNTVLMNKSFLLLNRKDLAISDVSTILGFSNNASFHRSFKRWAGVTPLKYRQDLK